MNTKSTKALKAIKKYTDRRDADIKNLTDKIGEALKGSAMVTTGPIATAVAAFIEKATPENMARLTVTISEHYTEWKHHEVLMDDCSNCLSCVGRDACDGWMKQS